MPDQYYCKDCGRTTPIKEEKCFDCGGNMYKAGDIGDDSDRDDDRYTKDDLETSILVDEDIDMSDESEDLPKKKSASPNLSDDDF